jgi:hypothetical protein
VIITRIGALCLGLALLVAAGVGVAHAQDPTEIAFWSMVKESRRVADIKAYLEAYPRGAYAEAARRRLSELERASAQPPPAPPPSQRLPAPAAPSLPSPTPSARVPALTDAAVIREVQERLYNLNYGITSISGRLTDETRQAIREWQRVTQRPQTGDMDTEDLAVLRNARLPVIWGALAYAARGASAVVWNRTSRQDAVNAALSECRSRNKSKDACKVVSAAEKACGALGFYTGTVGRTTHWGAYPAIAPTLGRATDRALDFCREQAKRPEACGIRLTFCADGSHRQ